MYPIFYIVSQKNKKLLFFRSDNPLYLFLFLKKNNSSNGGRIFFPKFLIRNSFFEKQYFRLLYNYLINNACLQQKSYMCFCQQKFWHLHNYFPIKKKVFEQVSDDWQNWLGERMYHHKLRISYLIDNKNKIYEYKILSGINSYLKFAQKMTDL
jgi:hypothetical protein